MLLIVFLAIAAWFAYKTPPETRKRLFRRAVDLIEHLYDIVATNREQCAPYYAALRARSRVVVTPAIVTLNIVVFVLMLFGAGALGDDATLIAWGANFGPRTTGGEWSRLVTAMFVHRGLVHLAIELAAIVQLGLILERLVGRAAFTTVYVAAGLLGSVLRLAQSSMEVSVGASDAVCGLYGLLLATWVWGLRARSDVAPPVVVARRLAPVAAIVAVYGVFAAGAGILAVTLVAGFTLGLGLMIGTSDARPERRRLGIVAAAAVLVLVANGLRVHRLSDARPEIARVIAVEDRTAGAYRSAMDQFRRGRLATAALLQLIDRTIVPELQAAQARLNALERVPHEQAPLVASAAEYLRLRDESWRLRAEGLRAMGAPPRRQVRKAELESDETWRARAQSQYRASMLAMGRAEAAERDSLAALDKVRSLNQQ